LGIIIRLKNRRNKVD